MDSNSQGKHCEDQAAAAVAACAQAERLKDQLSSSQVLVKQLQEEKEALRQQLYAAIQKSTALANQNAACSRAAAQLQAELFSSRTQQNAPYHAAWQYEDQVSAWSHVANLTQVCCVQAQTIQTQAWMVAQALPSPNALGTSEGAVQPEMSSAACVHACEASAHVELRRSEALDNECASNEWCDVKEEEDAARLNERV